MDLSLLRLAEHGFYLVVAVLTIGFGVLNQRFDLTRHWVKGFGKLFGASTAGQVIDDFAESRPARVFYQGLITTFAVFIGTGWLLISIAFLIGDFRQQLRSELLPADTGPTAGASAVFCPVLVRGGAAPGAWAGPAVGGWFGNEVQGFFSG